MAFSATPTTKSSRIALTRHHPEPDGEPFFTDALLERADMNRRTCLATLGGTGLATLGGCLDANTDRRPELQIQRPSTDGETDCVERELLDVERVMLAPQLAGPIGLSSAVQWEVDLQAGEELYLRITNRDEKFLPHLRVDDPEGDAIIDERPVDNSYTIRPQLDGRHVITVSNRRWTESIEWFVDLIWYSAAGCHR